MEGNSRSKWLGRSLAELIVIIAGVMIALAADRWIAGIDERAEARSYMARLADDLRQDTTALANGVRKSEERGRTALDMLHYSETGDLRAGLRPDSFVSLLTLMATPGTGETFALSTWKDMVSTGKVGLIRDTDLRRDLNSYYAEAERIGTLGGLGRPDIASEVLWELQPPLQALAALPWFLPPEEIEESTIGSDDAERLLGRLRSRKDFLVAVGHQRQLWIVLGNTHKAQLGSATQLLERLEAEVPEASPES